MKVVTVEDACARQVEFEEEVLRRIEEAGPVQTAEEVREGLFNPEAIEPLPPEQYAKERYKVRELLEEFFECPTYVKPTVNGPWRSHVYRACPSARQFYRKVFIDDYDIPTPWANNQRKMPGEGFMRFRFAHPCLGGEPCGKEGWSSALFDEVLPCFPDFAFNWELCAPGPPHVCLSCALRHARGPPGTAPDGLVVGPWVICRVDMNDISQGGEGHVLGTWRISGTHTGAPLPAQGGVGDPVPATGLALNLPAEQVRVRVVDLHVCEVLAGWIAAEPAEGEGEARAGGGSGGGLLCHLARNILSRPAE